MKFGPCLAVSPVDTLWCPTSRPSIWFEGHKVHLGGDQVVEDADKTLERLILFIQRLLFYLQDEGWLLQDSGIKNVALSTRQGGREHMLKSLTVKWSWTQWRGGRR